MPLKSMLLFACLLLFGTTLPAVVTTQSDLDAFMERVLARRDDNWKKLQQYILEERESFDLSGPGGLPLYGVRREYAWFIKQGIFVRSPVKANGVSLSEADRRKAEAEFIRRETRRDERRKRRAANPEADDGPATGGRSITISPTTITVTSADEAESTGAVQTPVDDAVLRQGIEPRFVTAAYFLKFRFESGHYALAGRENVDGREALKIEYYPREGLFSDDRSRRAKRVDNEDDEIEQRMNKVSMVTLWVDPTTHQILRYIFDDLDMDFLPGRALVRIDNVQAAMNMGQPFPDVWLPASIDMRFAMMLAVGAVNAAYQVDYLNYKQADVTYKIK